MEGTPTSEKVSEKELDINGEGSHKKHHKKSKKSSIKRKKKSEPAKHKKKKKKTNRDREEDAANEETKKGSKVKRHVDTITGRKESKKKHREHTL